MKMMEYTVTKFKFIADLNLKHLGLNIDPSPSKYYSE